MKKNLLIASMSLVALAMPLSARAQGIPGGATHGFNEETALPAPSARWLARQSAV
jgi:hypothetical protein